MRPALALATTLLALAATATAAAADVEVRRITRQLEVGGEHQILLDVPVGEVRIEPGEAGRVAIEIVILCDSDSRRCRRYADDIYLDDSLHRHTLSLKLRGDSHRLTGRPSIEVRLAVPPGNDLEVELGVGELHIEDLTGDVDADVGVGEVEVFAREAIVGAVHLSAGVGEADLRPHRRGQSESRVLFLGDEVSWNDGPGEARLVIEVGVGEVEVILD